MADTTKKYFTDASLETLVSNVKSYADQAASSAVADKAPASHTHDDRYYTESEIDTKFSTVNTSITNITNGSTPVEEAKHAESADEATHATNSDHATSADSATNATTATTAGSATKATQDGNGKVIADTYETKSDATAKLEAANAYTDQKTANLISTSAVDTKISTHNTSTTAHSDIRDLISALSTKVTNFLDVDDTTTDQLSEVLAMIEANEGTIESLTSNKVNVSDIVDNLTTNNASKVLSAAQGVALKGLIDALQTAVDGKADSGHSHTITATATDDDVIVLTGTNGTNKVTFDAKHANSGVTAGTYRSVTVNAKGHVTAGTNPTTISGYGITDAYTKTQVDSALGGKSDTGHVHDAASQTVAGFMSAADKKKLDGIAEGANKITVDSALSSTSTNPVQNSVVTAAINSNTEAIGLNTNSIASHTTAIANIQTELESYEEITSTEITALFNA